MSADNPIVRLRIRTRTEGLPADHRPRGQDTHVTAIHRDGTETPLHNVVSVIVNSRQDYVAAQLVVHGVELDAEATPAEDVIRDLRLRLNAAQESNARMSEQLRAIAGAKGE